MKPTIADSCTLMDCSGSAVRTSTAANFPDTSGVTIDRAYFQLEVFGATAGQ